jgi:phosphate-selective porin OprO/OprP
MPLFTRCLSRGQLLAALISLLLASSSFAQDAASKTTDEQTSATTVERDWNFRWNNRPSVRYGDLLRIDVRARVVSDMRRPDAALTDNDTSRFDIARRRIGVEGEIADVADFQIERELADRRPWRDVYVNFRGLDRVELQAGQFKLPFGLDENTSSTNLDFVYRSRAARLSPGRDPGLMAHGRVGVLRYEAGAFTQDGDNGRDEDARRVRGGWTTAGRLLVQPFRSSTSIFEDLQAGIAYTSSDVQSGIADLRGPNALREPFFRPEFAVQGMRRRVGLEMRWRPGPFSVQSELVRMSSERRGQGIDDLDLPSLAASAWYMHAAWVVTGERKTAGADEPRRPLFNGGFGSLEFAARVEGVRFSSAGTGPPSTGPRAETILPHREGAITLGINWSPNRWMRVQGNLIRDTISIPTGGLPLSGPLVDGPSSSFWSRVVRFRFAL